MLDKVIKAGECPLDLKEALQERGVGMDKELTITEALEHWSGWHLGDTYWGRQAADLVACLNTQSN